MRAVNYAEREEAEKQMLKKIDAAKGGIAGVRGSDTGGRHSPSHLKAFQDVGRRSIQDAFAAHWPTLLDEDFLEVEAALVLTSRKGASFPSLCRLMF